MSQHISSLMSKSLVLKPIQQGSFNSFSDTFTYALVVSAGCPLQLASLIILMLKNVSVRPHRCVFVCVFPILLLGTNFRPIPLNWGWLV